MLSLSTQLISFSAILFLYLPTICHSCTGKIDLVLCMDGSGSVGFNDYIEVQKFTKDFITEFSNQGKSFDGENGLKIGVSGFASGNYPFTDGLTHDYDTATAAAMKKRTSGGTRPDLCFDTAQKWLMSPGKGMRPDAEKIIFIITDGAPNNVGAAKKSSDNCIADGILIIGVGVATGSGTSNDDAIKEMITPPTADNYIKVDDFQGMKKRLQAISEAVCPIDCAGTWNAWGPCNPNTGERIRTFQVQDAAKDGGEECPKPETESCAIDCAYSYSGYSKCETTPTPGAYYGPWSQSRTVTVSQQPMNGGKACPAGDSKACTPSVCYTATSDLPGFKTIANIKSIETLPSGHPSSPSELTGDESALFYAYANGQSGSTMNQPGVSKFMVLRDSTATHTSLVILNGKSSSPTGSYKLKITFEEDKSKNVPAGFWSPKTEIPMPVADEPGPASGGAKCATTSSQDCYDEYDAAARKGRVNWSWGKTTTSGGTWGPLPIQGWCVNLVVGDISGTDSFVIEDYVGSFTTGRSVDAAAMDYGLKLCAHMCVCSGETCGTVVSPTHSKKKSKEKSKKKNKGIGLNKKSKGKPKDPSQKPFAAVGRWLQKHVFPIMKQMKIRKETPTSNNIYKHVKKKLFATSIYVGNSARNTSHRNLLPKVFAHAMSSALGRPRSPNGLEKEGTKYFRTQQGYLSPKERTKANEKIEVDYHKLRQARLAKDFHQVDRATWEEAGKLRRLPRQKDNSGSFTIYYILNEDVEVNYGKTKADRKRAYDEFGITLASHIPISDVIDTMFNPNGRRGKVSGLCVSQGSWLDMRLQDEFRWFGLEYRYRERIFSLQHKAVVASSQFQKIMNTGGPTAFYTRVELFCKQHSVSFSLLTPGGSKSAARKVGLRNMYLSALSIRQGISGVSLPNRAAVDAEGNPLTEISLKIFEPRTGRGGAEYVFKEEDGRQVLGQAKREEAEKCFQDLAKAGAIFYSFNGTQYEDYFMRKSGVKEGQLIDFYKCLKIMFPWCRPGATGKHHGSIGLPVINHLLHGPDAVYHHESLPDAKVLATTVSTFTRWFAEADQFIQFPSEVDMGVTKKMLKRLGLNREPRTSSWTRNEL